RDPAAPDPTERPDPPFGRQLVGEPPADVVARALVLRTRVPETEDDLHGPYPSAARRPIRPLLATAGRLGSTLFGQLGLDLAAHALRRLRRRLQRGDRR